MFILALFDVELQSLVKDQDTDNTLEGQEFVLLEVAKITFIVPRGSLEEASPCISLHLRACLAYPTTRMVPELL